MKTERPCDSLRRFELVDQLADAIERLPGAVPLEERKTKPGYCRLCGSKLKHAFVVGYDDERRSVCVPTDEAEAKGLSDRYESGEKLPGVMVVLPIQWCDVITEEVDGKDIYDRAQIAIRARIERRREEMDKAEKLAPSNEWE